jgi:uncharacterized protein YjlB
VATRLTIRRRNTSPTRPKNRNYALDGEIGGEVQERAVREGGVVVLPAGTYHNAIDTSKTAPVKLSTLCAPPNHPDGTVHKSKAEAEAAEAVEHS